mgnify:CR=1 FL=1
MNKNNFGIFFENFEEANSRLNVPVPEKYKEQVEKYWNEDDKSFVNFIIGLLV